MTRPGLRLPRPGERRIGDIALALGIGESAVRHRVKGAEAYRERLQAALASSRTPLDGSR